jgi:hypothetical protein
MRRCDRPRARQMLPGFLQDSYEAEAIHAGWDRAALEDDPDRWKAYQVR